MVLGERAKLVSFRNYENRNVVMVITVKPCWCVDTSGSRLLVLMGETSRKRTEGENAVKSVHPADRIETSDRCDSTSTPASQCKEGHSISGGGGKIYLPDFIFNFSIISRNPL